MLRAGLDIGGTKIEGVVIDDDGRQRARRRIATPRDYDAELRALAELVAALEAEAGGRVERVGAGIPGSLSPFTGLVRNANSLWMNGRPFATDLEAALARPVRVGNDANCFALSEAVDGAGAGAGVVFGVILGTGVGAGIVSDGRVLTGANHIGGEWGHNPLPWPEDAERPGPRCWCGKAGCVEGWLSGPGLAADHAAKTGRPLDAAAIAAAAEAGEPAATASLERYERRLARALATVVNLVDPDVVVLGGGLGGIARLYRTLPALLPAWCFSDRVITRIVPPRWGDASGVRGAAWLWEGGAATSRSVS